MKSNPRASAPIKTRGFFLSTPLRIVDAALSGVVRAILSNTEAIVLVSAPMADTPLAWLTMLVFTPPG